MSEIGKQEWPSHVPPPTTGELQTFVTSCTDTMTADVTVIGNAMTAAVAAIGTKDACNLELAKIMAARRRLLSVVSTLRMVVRETARKNGTVFDGADRADI